MDRYIFHIDCNAAFLSWEAVNRLKYGESIDIRTIPSVIGGDESSRHGIVLAKSIPAKKYGIQTAQCLYDARNRCPEVLIIPPNYDLYMRCSRALVDLLKEYSPLIERYSIDECFMDYTGCESISGAPVEVAYKIKERIKKELGFTVNIGVAQNKLLAKMASEMKKPDRLHTLFPHEIKEKMWPLTVNELFMVGVRTFIKLYKFGIATIGQLANAEDDFLRYHFKSWGSLLKRYANGIDDSVVNIEGRPIKGIGNSTTTSFDVVNREEALTILLSLVETVCMRLRDANRIAQVIGVALKTNKFEVYSHQRKIFSPTDSTNEIFRETIKLFDEMWRGEPLRLLNIRVSGLCLNNWYQCSIYDNGQVEKSKKLDSCIDEMRMKYGKMVLQRGVFLNSGLSPMTGGLRDEYTPMLSSLL